MKLYSWNVNGIRAVLKKDLFKPFMAAHQPDILCLQEIKSDQNPLSGELNGYHLFWNPALKKGYSGTAILSKEQPLNVTFGMPEQLTEDFDLRNDPYGDCTLEGRVSTAEFAHCFVVTVYTPNAKDDLSRLALREKKWDPAFLAYCSSLEQRKPVIFCGDLNVAHTELDLANPKPNRGKKGFTDEERAGFQRFVDAGFVDSFRLFTQGNGHYSWWSHFANSRARNVGWRIDYVMASPQLRGKLRSAAIHADVMGSDHCPVSIDIAW